MIDRNVFSKLKVVVDFLRILSKFTEKGWRYTSQGNGKLNARSYLPFRNSSRTFKSTFSKFTSGAHHNSLTNRKFQNFWAMVNSCACSRLSRAFYILTLCLLATTRNEQIWFNFEDVIIQRQNLQWLQNDYSKAQFKVSTTFSATKTLLIFVFELPQYGGILWCACMWYARGTEEHRLRARTARIKSKIPSCYWRKKSPFLILKCSFALSVKTCPGLYSIRCTQVLISVL